jgi:hypothetical protein
LVQDKIQPGSQQPIPSILQLLLFVLLLGWLSLAPILVGIGLTFLPPSWPTAIPPLLAVLGLALLLLLPFTAFVALVYQQRYYSLRLTGSRALVYWQRYYSLRPLSVALLATALYITVAALIRALPGVGNTQEMILRLLALTFLSALIGGLAMLWGGVPPRGLPQIFGIGRPTAAGLLLALVLIGLATLAWPITGALGDSYAAQLSLLEAIALSLPEALFFWGAILGLLSYSFPQQKALSIFLAVAIYWAFTPSLLVPHNDWSKLVLLLSGIPLACLLAELRLFTGSIWTGLLFTCIYRVAPQLFVDPRGELPLLTQPWQTAARLWMFLAAADLAVALGLGWRYWLARPGMFRRLSPLILALALAFLIWGVWLGLWVTAGEPGFHNDGFLIIMAEQADLSGAEAITDPLARRTFVRERLIETAQRTQAPVRQALDEAGLSYRPFYLINMIRVEGAHRRIADFEHLPGVAQVMLNPNVRPYPLHFELDYSSASEEGQGVEWNISQTGADQVWKRGVTGEGIVVAGQDTGYDWDHPALRGAYRGYGEGKVDHTYNWHDAWSETAAPFDDGQHGTHTMGSILGDDGHGNQIGMAPGAEWIGCRNMQRGLGNPASYTDCMEFFLAPYPQGGDPFTEGEVALAPQIINNSWGCPDEEGCDDTVLEPAAEALRAAGIMMVVSAGNEGPDCQTVDEPPARYDSVFSVGATGPSGQIAGFSSRGPVPDSASLLKPDITAPGENVRSSTPGGGYGVASGTSMAGPHVAGLVALIWSANPALIGQIEATEEIIRQSAKPISVSSACSLEQQASGEDSLLEELEALENPSLCACGGVGGTPNNVSGWGEIDALAAVELALEQK